MIIFVFGSNLAGVHGAGAAKTAVEDYGAKWGEGEGLFGNSYAIPTKDLDIRPLTVSQIRHHVIKFIKFAEANPDKEFFVTAIGCGLAGNKVEDIAPLFAGCPKNCLLPTRFADVLNVVP